MEEKKQQLLEEMGINIPEAMERFMGNEALLWQFLQKFTTNAQFAALQDVINSGDKNEALTISHNLKGLTGNLGLTHLHDYFTRQVKEFRAEHWETAISFMDEIMEEYERVVELIKKADQIS